MRQIPLLFAALSIVLAAIAQTGLNSLPEVEFSQLSQRDPNPLGERALSINPTQWKHGETEHYIYHFAHSYVATPISVEAEFHYRVVAKELERDHSQGSLFILRNPEQKFSGNLLGHEIVHLVLHRFYADGIPCWLNEGIAQYISKSAHASYQRARGYISKPHSEAIATEEMIPLATLVRLTRPPSDRVETFYDESERLVRFLVATDKPSFLALLDALGRHQPFETALPRIYPAKFATVATLEEKFREYAAKDFGTSLQQAEE